MSDLTQKSHDIENRSFEIIEKELKGTALDPFEAPIIKRVIHTTADFEYLELLRFSSDAIRSAVEAFTRGGVTIYTDTTMALSGVSKPALRQLNANAVCYVADEDVKARALTQNSTRSVAGIDKSLNIEGPLIYAIGNAPTALIRLCELIQSGAVEPKLVVGVPVGFVNVIESKEMLKNLKVPSIIVEGRKGGSTVSAAICNALLYGITRGEYCDSE